MRWVTLREDFPLDTLDGCGVVRCSRFSAHRLARLLKFVRRFAGWQTTRGDGVELGTSLGHHSWGSEQRCGGSAHCLHFGMGAAATRVGRHVRQCAHYIPTDEKETQDLTRTTDTPRQVYIHSFTHTCFTVYFCTCYFFLLFLFFFF